MDKQKYKDALWGGFFSNPVFILVLGMCPVIAQSYNFENAFALGVATAAVLIVSNVAISILRNVIPNNVRIPAYITIVATMVTTIMLLMESYMFELYQQLGAFLSLIAVNCIIMARLETYAAKNPPLPTLLDGVSMGAGFVVGISLLGITRELLTKAGFKVFASAAGGFLVLGFLIVLYTLIINALKNKKKSLNQVNAGVSPN